MKTMAIRSAAGKSIFRRMDQVSPFKTVGKSQYIDEFGGYSVYTGEGLSLKTRNSSSSFSLLPKMVIRDNEEALFFISPKTEVFSIGQDEVCICTNNQALVRALNGIFVELLHDSEDISNKVFEMETGPPSVVPLLEAAKKSKSKWLIFETIQYYLKALKLMKDHQTWSNERARTSEALGGLYALAADHELANEFYQKGIASTENRSVKNRLKRKIRNKKIVENDGTRLAYYVYGREKNDIVPCLDKYY